VAVGVEVREVVELGVNAQKNELNAPAEASIGSVVGEVQAGFPQAYLPHVPDASAPSVTVAVEPVLK